MEDRTVIKVLIVDDEKSICDLTDLNLSANGYHCASVQGEAEAPRFIKNQFSDLILLDIMLPRVDGYDTMSYIRPMDIPVVLITIRYEVKDRVKGPRLGAGDYLVKPFDVVELAARAEAVLRRYDKAEHLLTAGDMTMGMEARKVTGAGRNVELTNKEFSLLVLFAQDKNMALLRETLYGEVREGEYSGDSRAPGLYVQRLRRKLGWENNLVIVYKVGYRPGIVQ